MTNEQIRKIYNQLKSNITVDANETIETENVIFQILSLEEQKSNNIINFKIILSYSPINITNNGTNSNVRIE